MSRTLPSYATEFASDYANKKMPQCDKKKLYKKEYKDDLETAYLAGQLLMCEFVIKTDSECPYKDKLELKGDLQLASVDIFNRFTVLSKGRYRPISLEYFLENKGLVKENEKS